MQSEMLRGIFAGPHPSESSWLFRQLSGAVLHFSAPAAEDKMSDISYNSTYE